MELVPLKNETGAFFNKSNRIPAPFFNKRRIRIKSNSNRIRIELNRIEFESNRIRFDLIRIRIESNQTRTEPESIRFDQIFCRTLIPAKAIIGGSAPLRVH